MNIYPANEQRIWEVERGRSVSAILPLERGKASFRRRFHSLCSLDFSWKPGARFVKGGDSVRVVLTDVTDLEKTDPVTGEALFQITWEPLGQDDSPTTTSKRGCQVAFTRCYDESDALLPHSDQAHFDQGELSGLPSRQSTRGRASIRSVR